MEQLVLQWCEALLVFLIKSEKGNDNVQSIKPASSNFNLLQTVINDTLLWYWTSTNAPYAPYTPYAPCAYTPKPSC